MKEGQTVEEYIREINTLVSELGKTNYQIDQKRLINTVLHGLPRPRWENFIENFELYMRRNPNVQLSELVEELQAVELSRQVLHPLEAEAMIVAPPANSPRSSSTHGSSLARGRSSRGRGSATSRQPARSTSNATSALKCGYCGHPGHAERDCRTKTREQRMISQLVAQLGKSHQAHSAATEDHSDDDGHLEANMAALDIDRDPTWYLDSAASSHLTGESSHLTNVIEHLSPSSLTTASGHRLPVLGRGKAKLSDNKTLDDVLYVPAATRSLISVGQLADAGHIITFDAHSCSVVHSRTPQLLAYSGLRNKKNGLYTLHSCGLIASRLHSRPTSQLQVCAYIQATTPTALWHRRIGHVNFQRLRHMTSRGLVDGVPLLSPRANQMCETCVLAKHHRTRIPRISLTATTRPLELLHSDVCGPLPVPSRTGARYFLTITDDYSRFTWVHPIASKSDVFPRFQSFRKSVEAQFHLPISCLRSDRGGGRIFIH